MEAQKRSSKKRKQSSSSSSSANSNPFAGILTRHKSQKFFFHHNRSGKSRKCVSFPSSLNNPRFPTEHRLFDCANHDVSCVDDDELDLISIKDLRARRVFSTPPKSVDVVGKNVIPEFDSESIVSKSGKSGVKVDGDNILGENPSLTVNEKCDSGTEFKEKVLNVENPNLSIPEKCGDSGVNLKEVSSDGNPKLSVVEKCVDSRVNSNGKCLNGGNPNFSIEGFGAEDDSGCRFSDDMSPNLRCKDVNSRNGEHCEENVQTPPDAVVLFRQTGGSDSRSPPVRISPSKGGTAEGKKSFSNSRRNLALNPCSRMKVFKAPNSFSYRRMLPFLMDLAKDASSAPKVNQSIETDVEEKTAVSSSQESVMDHCKEEKPLEIAVACEPPEMSTMSKEEEKLLSNPKTNDSSVQETAHCTLIECPIENSQENSVCEESQIGTPISDYSKNGGALLDRQVSIDTTGKSEDISPIIESDLAATLHSPKTNPEPSNEDATLNSSSYLALDDERNCSAPLVEVTPEDYPISVFHSSSKMEAAVSPDEQGFSLAKGILKRNPRGCRGVCNCLSCASFRLNAERAFEFSRNQWLDAEELAMDLMKELSYFRDMLEKNVSGANDNAVVPVDQLQELCRRASTVEDTARSRLNQMNEDLHAHCRIKHLQRPRVSFSKSVQEKTVGTTKQRR